VDDPHGKIFALSVSWVLSVRTERQTAGATNVLSIPSVCPIYRQLVSGFPAWTVRTPFRATGSSCTRHTVRRPHGAATAHYCHRLNAATAATRR
jgi:hypothetical protein